MGRGKVTKRRIVQEAALPKLQAGMRDAMVKANYDAASTDRLVRTRTGLGGSADSHVYTALQLYNLRENARDLIRNHPIMGQLVRRFADNVLGTGLVIDPETSSEAWNKKAQKLWEAWCNDPTQCDVSRRRTFDQLERLALTSATIDGDCFAIIDDLSGGAVALVEGEHVAGSDDELGVLLGVEINRTTSAHEAYWFRQYDHLRESRRRGVYSTDNISTSTHRRIPVQRSTDNLIHCVQILQDDYRISANRGITFLAPVFARASAYEDTEWAQLVQQQIAACVAVFLQSEYPADFGKTDSETIDGYTAALEELTPGLIARLRPGEKIGTLEPKAPGQDSHRQLMHIVREISLQLDMPLSISMLVTSDTTFHGYRGELQQARKSFERRQKWFGQAFRGQVYRRKVADWIREGKLRPRKDWDAYRIQGPSWPYVDPSKDAQADTERLSNGSISPRRLHRERGQDWDRVSEEIVSDYAAHITRALKAVEQIKSKFPDADVHWRDLANLEAPNGAMGSQQAQTPNEPQQQEEPEPNE